MKPVENMFINLESHPSVNVWTILL